MSYSDGWEDLLRRSLYGSLAVEVNHPPVALALENMTEQRGAAENLVAVSQKAMKLGTGNFSSLSLQTIRQPCSLTAANSRRYFPQPFPPLSTKPRDADDLLAGPESISPDNVAAEFAALEELMKTEEVQTRMDEVKVLEGNAFDFGELDRVEQGIIAQAILDEVEVVNYNGEDTRQHLMSSLAMSYT